MKMKPSVTMALQFVTAIVFMASAVLYFLAGKIILGVVFLAVSGMYLGMGLYYKKHYKD